MDEHFGAPALPAPPAARATIGSAAPTTTRTRRVVAVAIAVVLLADASLIAVALAQGRTIGRLNASVDRARDAEASLTGRIDATDRAQTSTAARVDGLLDPELVVSRSQGSVFTLLAGPWLGSAFVVASDDRSSTLITNFHVVRALWDRGVHRVVIRNADTSFNATVRHVWPNADLAVVHVTAPIAALETAPSSVQVGEPIVVMGSPFGYGGTVSTGVVSAIRDRSVQFSAPVSPGSSGGPVLDADGQVIGVTTTKVEARGAEGLSFAIPIWFVCRLTAAC